MAGRKAKSRIYWRGGRERAKDGTVRTRVRRAWADLRDYNGKLEPLVARERILRHHGP